MNRALLLLPFMAAATGAQACDATLAVHDALVSEMTLAQVVDVVGCDGIPMSERTADGVQLDSYIWEGNGAPGSNMILLFADGALINKQQIGLR